MNESSHDARTNKPLALILQTAGTNCDRELAHAFELAGASARTVHVNSLIEDPGQIQQYQLIGFPGGFSYGDDIAAGRIFASRLRHGLLDALLDARRRGVPMIGICNGFQVMVKLGFLPDPETAADGEDSGDLVQTATLADNAAGRFIDRWLTVEADPASVCVWTRGIATDNQGRFDLPIAHGEGRFVPIDEQQLEKWRRNGQIALRYAVDQNVNGSTDRIAGVCDSSGLILGLMPHPERFILPTQHPQWTRQAALGASLQPLGLTFFRNAVNHVKAQQPALSASGN